MVCCLAWYVTMACSGGKSIRQQRLWEGLAEGLVEGLAEGLAKGLAKGLARGTVWPARPAAQESGVVHMNFLRSMDFELPEEFWSRDSRCVVVKFVAWSY